MISNANFILITFLKYKTQTSITIHSKNGSGTSDMNFSYDLPFLELQYIIIMLCMKIII